MLCIIHGELRLMRRKIHIVMSEIVSDENDKLNRCIKALHLKYIVAYIITIC